MSQFEQNGKNLLRVFLVIGDSKSLRALESGFHLLWSSNPKQSVLSIKKQNRIKCQLNRYSLYVGKLDGAKPTLKNEHWSFIWTYLIIPNNTEIIESQYFPLRSHYFKILCHYFDLMLFLLDLLYIIPQSIHTIRVNFIITQSNSIWTWKWWN